MTTQISLRIKAEDLAELDAAIARGSIPSRCAALRAGLELILRHERERVIDEAYRRGSGEHPQEDWIGANGLALFAASARAEALDEN